MALLAVGGSTGVEKVLGVDAQLVLPLREHVILWHDRDYVMTSVVPDVMAGGYYVQQQIKTIEVIWGVILGARPNHSSHHNALHAPYA